jgi:hypothetical protein
MERDRPSWGISVWSGFACLLLAFGALFQGSLGATGLMLGGAAFLFAWAGWLARGEP